MSKKTGKSNKSNATSEVNYKKLFFEVIAALAIAFAATLAILQPILKEKIDQIDKYKEYREIVDRVDNYDYSKGRDFELEKELDETISTTGNNKKLFFYSLASGIYYCKFKLYGMAKESFEYIEFYETVEDEEEVAKAKARRVICERQQQAEEKAKNEV